jgi:hypothetical protein
MTGVRVAWIGSYPEPPISNPVGKRRMAHRSEEPAPPTTVAPTTTTPVTPTTVPATPTTTPATPTTAPEGPTTTVGESLPATATPAQPDFTG